MGERRSDRRGKRVKERENVAYLRTTPKVWEGEAFLRRNRSVILRSCTIVTSVLLTLLILYLIFKYPVVRCTFFYEGTKGRYVCRLPYGWKIADATNIKDQTGAVTLMLRPIGRVPLVIQSWMWLVMLGTLIVLLFFLVISIQKDTQSRQRLAKDIRRADTHADDSKRLSRSRTKGKPQPRNRSASSSDSSSSEASTSSYTSRSPSPIRRKSRRRRNRRAVNKLEYI